MEAITGLVLIFLSSVGARNIPVQMDQRSKLPLIFADDLPSYTKTYESIATIFPSGELVESMDYITELRLHLNKNNDEDSKVEDYVSKVMDLDNDFNEKMDIHESVTYEKKTVSNNDQENEAVSIVTPVEAIVGQKSQKAEEALLEFRNKITTGKACPKGKIRVGDFCLDID